MMSPLSFSSLASTKPVTFSANRSAFTSVQFSQQAPTVQFGSHPTWEKRLIDGLKFALKLLFSRKPK